MNKSQIFYFHSIFSPPLEGAGRRFCIVLNLFLILIVLPLAARAQADKDLWATLFGVKYGDWKVTFKPVYNEKISALNGKRITIKGFLIPMEEKSKHSFFLLSAFPFDACFYCGKAGPESVIEVTVKKPLKSTNKPITITGTLQLNHTDPDHLFYLINDGELVE